MNGHSKNACGFWRVHRYEYRHDIILGLIKRNPYALDLAKSNPVLLWLVAHAVGIGTISPRDAARLVNRKQSAMLRTLYPENSALSAAFVRKIQPADYNEDEFTALEMLLKGEDSTRRLRHCTRICLQSLAVFYPHGVLLELPLVRECLESRGYYPDFYDRVRRAALQGWRYADVLNHGDPWGVMARCATYPQLRSLVERWEEKAASIVTDGTLSLKSSIMGVYPPIAQGVRHIEPITSLMGLFIEGQDMNHCVNDYDTEVMVGEATAYRVLSPQRGTLLLGRDPDGFAILDFRLANNKEPSEESWGAVRSWLRRLNQADSRHPRTGFPATRQAPLPA